MRMTAKGQVTIPQAVREEHDLGPGAQVEVVSTPEGALVRTVRAQSRGAELVARLRDTGDSGLSAEAILRLTRGE